MLSLLLTVPGDRFEYELNLLLWARRADQPIEEVPITTVYMEGNASSRFRPLVDSVRIYLPFLAFAASSLLASVIDTGVLLVLAGLTGAVVPSAVAARVLSGTVNFGYLVQRNLAFACGGSLRGAPTYCGIRVRRPREDRCSARTLCGGR